MGMRSRISPVLPFSACLEALERYQCSKNEVWGSFQCWAHERPQNSTHSRSMETATWPERWLTRGLWIDRSHVMSQAGLERSTEHEVLKVTSRYSGHPHPLETVAARAQEQDLRLASECDKHGALGINLLGKTSLSPPPPDLFYIFLLMCVCVYVQV